MNEPTPTSNTERASQKKFPISISIRNILFCLCWLVLCITGLYLPGFLFHFLPVLLLLIFDELGLKKPALVTAAIPFVYYCWTSFRSLTFFTSLLPLLCFLLLAFAEALPILFLLFQKRLNAWLWVAIPFVCFLLLFLLGWGASSLLLYCFLFAKGTFLDRSIAELNAIGIHASSSSAPAAYSYLDEYKKNMKK